MATDQGIDQSVGRQRIRLDDDVYERVSNGLISRDHRSLVSLYTGDDIKDMDHYKYRRLHSMRRRIRLLRLHGGGLSNPEITCELFEVEYDKEQQNVVKSVENNTIVKYEALSWCWGREEKDRAIRIQENGEYYRVAVTKELSLALKYLRHRHKNRILWIDALCIDQQNHEERNHQVQMMARIYNGATQACIWLGEDNDDSTKAIEFIQYVFQNISHVSTVPTKLVLSMDSGQAPLKVTRDPRDPRAPSTQVEAMSKQCPLYSVFLCLSGPLPQSSIRRLSF